VDWVRLVSFTPLISHVIDFRICRWETSIIDIDKAKYKDEHFSLPDVEEGSDEELYLEEEQPEEQEILEEQEEEPTDQSA
jgi:hypothetical protein